MKTTEQGRAAEAAVAEHLRKRGYKIIDQNWRTRLCEIDVIVQKDKVIYFVEVKYRGSDVQGDGFEYITHRKLDQMNFAADNWTNQNSWLGDFRLLAAAVSGANCENIDIIEL